MILEAAAWMLGALIGNAVGLVVGYRMGFVACDQNRSAKQLRWPELQLSQLDRRRRRRRA